MADNLIRIETLADDATGGNCEQEIPAGDRAALREDFMFDPDYMDDSERWFYSCEECEGDFE